MNLQNSLHREVRRRFSGLKAGNHRIEVSVDGVSLNFRANIVPGATRVVFNFHGAGNRQKRTLPIFNSHIPELNLAHQVAVSDPSLVVANTLRIAWFAGHEGFDTQYRLRGALRNISKALGVERSIYFGASGGGFAALYYSFYAPGSIAMVANPQTNILNYPVPAVNLYRKTCWPGLARNEQLAEATCANLAPLYREGFRNTVVYIQSMGDRPHATLHMLPFVGAIAGQAHARNFLLQSHFEGEHGHVSDYKNWYNWVRAAALSPTDDPKDLLDTWHEIRTRDHAAAAPVSAPTDRHGFRAEDLAAAGRLRAYRKAHP